MAAEEAAAASQAAPAAAAAAGGGGSEASADAPPFDVSRFRQVLDLPALRVSAKRVGELQKIGELKALFYRRRGIRNVLPVPDGEANGGGVPRRDVLFQPDVKLEALPEQVRELVSSGGAEFTTHTVELGYEQATAEEALRSLLPEGVEVPRGFETVGHLAHFNLKEQQFPHRKAIGRVILDKNPCIKTVVTKVGSLSNEFRTFDMEVIAGRDDTDVTVCERGLKLRFDFKTVYWNSRLSEERVRLLAKVDPRDIVLDLFAGVGAFALLAAQQGCRVVANDLNPSGSEAIRRNAELNRIQLEVHNLCARACTRALADAPRLERIKPPKVHVVMNLPQLALDFLDAFREMVTSKTSQLFSGSAVELCVHCYCFAREKDCPEKEIHPRMVAAMGCVPEGTAIREVRDVAPKKNMYCVEFAVPLAGRGAAAGAAAEDAGEAKRQKTAQE